MTEAMNHFFLHGIGSRTADAEPSDTDTRSISSTSSITSTHSTRSTRSTPSALDTRSTPSILSTHSTPSALSTNSTTNSSSSTTSTRPRLSTNGLGLRASQRWHQLTGLDKWLPPLLPRKADVASTVEALFAPASALPVRLLTAKYLRAVLLSHTQDAHADFDSLHFAALQQLVRRDADVALVLPAAGGKTLLLMLLECVEVLGVTIIIMPFKALLDDMARRCPQHDVQYSRWMAGSCDNDCQLVLVKAEQALLPAFGAWAIQL
jgi:superfamily II DNA helicase RecQ